MKKIINYISKIQKDKLLHFIAGSFVAQITIGLISLIWHLSYGGCIIGFFCGAIIAALKEIYDYFNKEKHTPELKDFIYTTVGSFISSVITLCYVI